MITVIMVIRNRLLNTSDGHLAIVNSRKPTKQWVFFMFDLIMVRKSPQVMSKCIRFFTFFIKNLIFRQKIDYAINTGHSLISKMTI